MWRLAGQDLQEPEHPKSCGLLYAAGGQGALTSNGILGESSGSGPHARGRRRDRRDHCGRARSGLWLPDLRAETCGLFTRLITIVVFGWVGGR